MEHLRTEIRQNHRWTVEHHITLAFLVRTYDNSWNDFQSVFNSYFSRDLRSPNGLSSSALASMYYDMQRGITGKTAMNLLRQTALSFTTHPTLVDQESIERTASELGIHLVKRLPGALSRGTQTPKKKRRAKRKVALSDDSEHEPTPRTPKKRQRIERVPQTPKDQGPLSDQNGLLTPPATIGKHSDSPPKRLPPVAYRAFSSGSQGSYSEEEGFCAGAFVGSHVPLPPNPESQEYIDEAKRHVAPIPTGPTPFISTTTSIVRAIHRALKLGPDASICVLSLELADAEGRVQSACALKLQHLVDHFYIPYNEFLIYGKIHPSAILSIMPISRLLDAIPSIPSDIDPFKILLLRDSKSLRPVRIVHKRACLPLSCVLGYAVGKLVRCLGIPNTQPIWEYAVTNLVVDFKFGQGLNRRSEWEELNNIFQNAVMQGYQRATLTELEVIEGTTIVRRIKEEQAYDSGRLDYRGGGMIPNNDLSKEGDEIPFCERMTDIWQYAETRNSEVSACGQAVNQEGHLSNVNAFRDPEILDNSDGRLSDQFTPGECNTRQDLVPEESSGIDGVRYASALNEFRVHNAFNGRYAIRPKMGDTLHILHQGSFCLAISRDMIR